VQAMFGMRRSTPKTFLTYFAAVPIALALSLFGRYGPGIGIIPQAIPMVAIVCGAFVLNAIFLTKRPITLAENFVFLGTTSVCLSFLVSVVIIFFFRLYYSIGFLVIFFFFTVAWVVFLERSHTRSLFGQRYALVPFGRHKIAKNLPLQCSELHDLNSLRQIHGDTIVVDFAANIPLEWTYALADAASRGVSIIRLSELAEFATGRAMSELFSVEDLYGNSVKMDYSTLKRMVDMLVALTALCVLFFPSIIVGLLVIFTSRGPALFMQQRVGYKGDTFTLLKFRTMYESTGQVPSTTQKNDARITPLGRFLRRARIDEWPQLLNVLVGNMSVVGPRPEQPLLVDSFTKTIPHYHLRHLARPGITGWAQINQGYTDDYDATKRKLEFDLYYVKKMNLFLDVKIILKTISVLLTGAGYR